MNSVVVILVVIVYFTLLFIIASIANRRPAFFHKIIKPEYIYGLSIAVYCTAWTFFGSVGNAAKTGVGFLPVYLGPSLMMPLIGVVWLKMIRICKEQRITNLSDFISSRYGNNITLGIVVTLFYVLGIIPYIAIQLKAISNCIGVLSDIRPFSGYVFLDSTFYISISLIVFTIIYGTRNIDATEKHTGLITVVAFESIVKLLAFLAVGFFVCFWVFDGPIDIFKEAKKSFGEMSAVNIDINSVQQSLSWLFITIVSALAMIMLPRQFQVAVVENTDEQHVRKSIWFFPLYLFLINIFVLPIALAGMLYFPAGTDADTFVLSFPLIQGASWLSLLVFVGGLSAATGMVIMETIALTTMISNSIIIPTLVSRPSLKEKFSTSISSIIIFARRLSIVVIILLAYIYEKTVAEHSSLVSIGMISFAAVAQIAPALLGGMYWKHANKKAALVAIITGFVFWFYTLIIPTFQYSNSLVDSILQNGIGGISWLRPTSLFGFKDLDPLSHGIFWSLLFNVLLFIGISLYTKRTSTEILQADVFVNIYLHENEGYNKAVTREGKTDLLEIKKILSMFLGEERSNTLLNGYAQRHKISMDNHAITDIKIVNFAERVLAGVIGSSSARMMMSAVTNEEKITINEILGIAKESQQTLNLNKELRKKSNDLTKATEQLKEVNEQLKRMDELKDEFLYTVTHELRTPLTAIRALSEVLYDNPDMSDEQKEHYLGSVISETERMTHLISQVLSLERFESGRQRLNISTFDLLELMKEMNHSLEALLLEKKLSVTFKYPDSMLLVRCDRDLIGQVIYNLLSNAIKFAQKEIVLSAELNYDEIVVSITDDGKGVPEDFHSVIFDKFYQVKNRQLQKPEGSGLGLAISKRIIEMHGESIWVGNERKKGAKFSFTLHQI